MAISIENRQFFPATWLSGWLAGCLPQPVYKETETHETNAT